MLMVMVLGGSGTIAEYGGEEVESAGSGGRLLVGGFDPFANSPLCDVR